MKCDQLMQKANLQVFKFVPGLWKSEASTLLAYQVHSAKAKKFTIFTAIVKNPFDDMSQTRLQRTIFICITH